MRTIVLLLAVASASTCAFAQMYKWVDKDGKTHYTDSPPPQDAKTLAPPKGASAPATSAPSASRGRGEEKSAARADGKPEGAQGTFKPEEEAALRTVCGIYLLESLTCQLDLNRYCSLDELVKGIGGNPNKGLKRDPRSDPNYDYRVEVSANDVVISAAPRAAGLTGFLSTKDSGTRYNPAGAAGKGDRKVVGPQSCPSESK